MSSPGCWLRGLRRQVNACQPSHGSCKDPNLMVTLRVPPRSRGSLPERRQQRWRGLIEGQPVAAHFLETGPKLLRPDWLLNAAVGAKLIALRQLPRIIGGGEDDDGDHTSPGVGA